MPITIELKKPIQRGENELKQLELRDVTTGDYVKLGPIMGIEVTQSGQRMTEFLDKARAYIVRIGGITDKEVNSLALSDFIKAKEFVKNQLLFGEGSEEAESPN